MADQEDETAAFFNGPVPSPHLWPIIPAGDQPRCRPTMVQDPATGEATIYIEIVLPAPYVHAMMSSQKLRLANLSNMGRDLHDGVNRFLERTAAEYFATRKDKP